MGDRAYKCGVECAAYIPAETGTEEYFSVREL